MRTSALPASARRGLLRSLARIFLSPITASNVTTELPGPILNRAALFQQRLLRVVHFARKGSGEEDHDFTKLFIAYLVVFRKSTRGELGWRTIAGRLVAMTARLAQAESGDFTGLWHDMLKAHAVSSKLETSG